MYITTWQVVKQHGQCVNLDFDILGIYAKKYFKFLIIFRFFP